MSGDGQQLQIILDQLAQTYGLPPPPPITPDAVAPPGSVIDQLLVALGLASNSGDPADNLAAQGGHAERVGKIGDALTKFPANEEQSAQQLAALGDPEKMLQMAQQLPQMATGLMQGVTGALNGAMQPLNQIPQQVAQVGQQAMQMGMGALQQGAQSGAAAGEAIPGELLSATGDAGDLLGAGGADLAGTAPAAMLGPPPTPSAGTVPASSSTTPPSSPGTRETTTAPRGMMGGVPMVPPGALHGAGAQGNDAKADTKRVVAPSVRNGAPVQGRITPPSPATEVTKRVEGKPVVASRRILLPDHTPDDDSPDTGR